MMIDPQARARLESLGLWPGVAHGAVAFPGASTATLRDGYRGALLGTAIGDALGRPAEGSRHAFDESSRAHYAEFQRWPGWQSGPEGTITDDTQMTICVAESLIATGLELEPVGLGGRFAEWLHVGRGKGRTCVTACRALADGVVWWKAGVEGSAGNGAAMRSAPIGLAHPDDLDALRRDAAVSASITHADPMAVVSAVAHAWLIARLVSADPGALDADRLVGDLCDAISDLYDPGAPERDWERRGLSPRPVRLVDRLAEVPGKLSMPRDEAGDYFYCGAFVLESLPMALWHFLAAPEDPETAVVNAVMGGFDADTVASMTGAYAGAYLGCSALPERWRGDNLEYSDDLCRLADRLFDLANH